MRFSETGSNCMSRRIAIFEFGEPAKLSLSNWVLPSWPWMSRNTSRGSTAMFTGAPPP